MTLGCGDVFSDLPVETVQEIQAFFEPYEVYPDDDSHELLVHLSIPPDEIDYLVGDNANNEKGVDINLVACADNVTADDAGNAVFCGYVTTTSEAEVGEHIIEIYFVSGTDQITGQGSLRVSAPVGN